MTFESWNGHQIQGGKMARICTINCGSLPARWQQLVDKNFDVCCVQESRATQQHLNFIGGKIRAQHLCIHQGAAPSLKRYGHATMIDKEMPGVVTIVRDSLQAAPLDLPDECRLWFDRGRMQALNLSTPLGDIKLVNCYLPASREERQSMNVCLIRLMPWLMAMPCLLVGDFNEPIDSGAVGMELRSCGWHCPQLTDEPIATYGQNWKCPDSAIDAIWVSPHLRDHVHSLQVTELTGMQHRMISLELAMSVDNDPMFEWIPYPALSYHKKSKEDIERIWSSYMQEYLRYLEDGNVDAAWGLWSLATTKCMHADGKVPLRTGKPQFRRAHAQHHSSNVAAIQRKHQSGELNAEDAEHYLNKARKSETAYYVSRWKRTLLDSSAATGRQFFAWLRGPPRLPPNALKDPWGVQRGRAQCLLALRRYWANLYHHDDARPTPDQEENGQVDEIVFDASDSDLLTQIVRSTSSVRATGMDSWRCAEWRLLPQFSIDMLLMLFRSVLRHHRCPLDWLIMKMAMIPKKQYGVPDVSHFRPIAVCGIPYRTFSKFVAVRAATCLTSLDGRMCGGIRGRGTQQAWLDLVMRLERVSLGEEQNPYDEVWPQLCALQIDTQKYFDSIEIGQACELMRQAGIDGAVICTWHFFVRHHIRYLFYGGVADPQPIKATTGVPQGDSLSVIAGVLVMGAWTTFLDTTTSVPSMRLFIDDRIMYHHELAHLQTALLDTEKWDTEHNLLSKEKTHVWMHDKRDVQIQWQDGTLLPNEPFPKYVGIPMMVKGRAAGACYTSIVNKGIALRDRLACAPVKAEQKLRYLLAILIPSLLYPSLVVRPTSSQVSKLRAICRAVSWSGSKFAASLAISLFLRKTHQYDPWLAMLCHSGKLIWQLSNLPDGQEKAAWCALWFTRQQTVLTPHQQGLASVWLRDLHSLGWTMELDLESAVIFNGQGEQIADLRKISRQHWLHILREAGRCKLLTQLGQLSSRWKGAEGIDIDASTRVWRGMHSSHPLRCSLASILTMSVATPTLLYKAKQVPTAACAACGCEQCDLHHLLWECPAWEPLRCEWPYSREQLQACSLLVTSGLLVTAGIPDFDKDRWQRLQLGAAELIARWQAAQRTLRASVCHAAAQITHTECQRQELQRPLVTQQRLPPPPLRQVQFGAMSMDNPLWHLTYRIPDTKEWPYGITWFFVILRFLLEATWQKDAVYTWPEMWLMLMARRSSSQLGTGFLNDPFMKGQIWRMRQMTSTLLRLLLPEDHWVWFQGQEARKWSQFLPPAEIAMPGLVPLTCHNLRHYIEAYEHEALERLVHYPKTQCGEAVRSDAVLQRVEGNAPPCIWAPLLNAPLQAAEFSVRLVRKQTLPPWRLALPASSDMAVQTALDARKPFALEHDLYARYEPHTLARWIGPRGIRPLQHGRGRFLKLLASLEADDTHILEPLWCGGVTRCIACGKRRDPAKIVTWEPCTARSHFCIPQSTLQEWTHRVRTFIDTVESILAALSAPEVLQMDDGWRDSLRAQATYLGGVGNSGVLDLFKSPHHKRARGAHLALRHTLARWTAIRDAWKKGNAHKVVCRDILSRADACLCCDRKPPVNAGLARWLREECKPCREGGLVHDGDFGLIQDVHGLLERAHSEFNST